MHPLLSAEVGRSELLLGNEAVVRGAIEAGVRVVSGYPGTPASEIGDTFCELKDALGISFEYSVNEKVALEVAYGASLAGVRSLTSMKHLGLTYAADPLSTMPYIGVVGGMVIVSAADPGCLTSPNEQDQRHLGRMLGLPTLDPSSPAEALAMTRWAFELSEACELPVLLRITTRVCHSRAPVPLGALPAKRAKGEFKKNPSRFLPTPANARRLREELQRRLDRACELVTASPFNPSTPGRPVEPGKRRLGLVSAGAPRNVVRHLRAQLPLELPHLELGALHPLPHDVVVPFLRSVDEVLVVEELTPYLEDSLLAIAHHYGVAVRIHGKRDGQMPWPFELEPEEVERRLREFAGLGPGSEPSRPPVKLPIPIRPPVLCPGCLHRNAFHVTSAVFGAGAIYVNDIGCYTLGSNPPYQAGDVLLAMGSSIPMAGGLARATGQRAVAFIGDSTFFHSGVPALVNAVEQKDDVVVVVLDNHVTAMTGMQPNASSVHKNDGATRRRIGPVVRALGVEDVVEVDTSDLLALTRALTRAKEAKGLSVVVAEGPCAVDAAKQKPQKALSPAHVDPERCHTCGMKEAGLHCGLTPTLASQRRLAVQRVQETPLGEKRELPRTSPCSLECPLGICVPAYVGAIAAGEPERAYAAVELRAALPSVCSHICHRPCEDVCVRTGWERPVGINALKRHLTERREVTVTAKSPPGGPKVAVVGAGPAGLAAARELVRRGYAPTLFDGRERPGGMLEYAIPEHRLPRKVLRRDVDAVLAEGVRFEGGRRLGRDFTLDSLRAQGFSATLLALGAQKSFRPPVPGVELPGVSDALDFLERPEATLQGLRVLVVGGGDVAMDAARVALLRGAREARVVFPEGMDEVAAAADALQLAREEGAALLCGHAVSALAQAEEGGLKVSLGRVVGFERVESGVRWQRLEPAGAQLVDRVIFATGQRVDLEGLGLPGGVFDEGQRLRADAHGRTGVPGLFIAGDVVSGPSTVTAAMAFGVRAAFAIDEALAGKDAAVAPCAAPLPRGGSHHPRAHRELHFRESAPPLTAAEARSEAERCLLCGMCANCNTCVEVFACPAITRDDSHGTPWVVAELCTSCGACLQVCPNQAIGGCA